MCLCLPQCLTTFCFLPIKDTCAFVALLTCLAVLPGIVLDTEWIFYLCLAAIYLDAITGIFFVNACHKLRIEPILLFLTNVILQIFKDIYVLILYVLKLLDEKAILVKTLLWTIYSAVSLLVLLFCLFMLYNIFGDVSDQSKKELEQTSEQRQQILLEKRFGPRISHLVVDTVAYLDAGPSKPRPKRTI